MAAFETVRKLLPDVVAVACFDTAFHASLPAAAATYAAPPEWRQRNGVRRYGFHGLAPHSVPSSWRSRPIAGAVAVQPGPTDVGARDEHGDWLTP